MTVANFKRIEAAVNIEINRLLPHPNYEGSTRQKAQKIMSALERLYLVVKHHHSNIPKRPTIVKIDSRIIDQVDISTIESMLDARIDVWESEIPPSNEQGMEFNGRRAGYKKEISLRTALNIAHWNFFNAFGGDWGPLWGKATALENVENLLKGTTSKLN